jgi:hypothetical protein
MAPLRLGAAHLCVTNNVPIVPVVLRGTYAAMPRGRNWPMPGRPRVVVRYGPALHPEDGEGARGFNLRIGQAISRLWSEEELGWYGSLRAQAEGRLALPTGPEAVLSGPLSGPSPAELEPAPLAADQAAVQVQAPVKKVASWRRTWESTRPLAGRSRPSAWQDSD